MNLSKNRLLVICDAYRNFQKDPIDCISSHFEDISVLIRYNPLAEISSYINVPSLKIHKLSSKIDITNKPSNVHLYPIPLIYLPFDSQYKILGEKHFKYADRLIRKKKIKFDLIHAHFTWPSGYVGAKLKEKYNVPLIVTTHGYDIYNLPFKDREWKSNIEYALNSADEVITVSNSNLEYIKKLDVKTPVTVLPNGYKGDLFYPLDTLECRKFLGIPTDKKIIISIGNLETIKGHEYLVEAMNFVIKQREDVICYIIGGGSREPQLKKQIKCLELQSYVKIVGYKPHSEIPVWINSCDFFVLPSLNEGNPTVMFECLGCGKPFIGTKVGGVPEIIISDNYGLLTEPKNAEDLAKKLLLALDTEWNQKIILNYAKNYTWENITNCIHNTYS
jgi:glycosyltransferase involved in cell wall biosynthesis